MCDVEGEVRCFEDGSAICSGHVYTGFVANTATGQSVCDVTKVEKCWNGKTWCEGDVLKRCDKCLGQSRCLQVTTEAVCDPGACTNYLYPVWLADANQTVHQDAMGCAVAAPLCDGTTDAICVGDKPAACVAPGQAVIALSCGDFPTFFGVGAYFGPYCTSSASVNAVCAQDPVACNQFARCDPSDPSGQTLQWCIHGVWFESVSCNRPAGSSPTTHCQAGTVTSACE
jgi:hypothetical protein